MEEKYYQLFKTLGTKPVPEALADQILTKLSQLEKKRYYYRLSVFSLLALGSLALTVPLLTYLSQDLSQSGLTQYLSLLWSDSSFLANNWQNFTLSILEIIPVLSLSFFLGGLATVVWSFSKVNHQLKLKLLKA
jgi:hypothetical protein